VAETVATGTPPRGATRAEPALERVGGLLTRVPPIDLDALLYGASALFALFTSMFAKNSDYRLWGRVATVAYLVATVICLAARAAAPALRRRVRGALLLGLFLSVVVGPLCAEIAWRAEGAPGAHAQPEVAVVERAGDRIASGASPYLAAPRDEGISPSSDARSVNATSYFPYLPTMALFGIPSAWWSGAAGDARWYFVALTLGAIALALALARRTGSLRGVDRVIQFLIVLPLGALPLVTGGDDLPVLGLMLLALVLGEQRHPLLAGLTAGLAATLKFTAWPILVLLALSSRSREGRRATGPYLASVVAISLPITLLGYLSGRRGFVENVIRFPLGLGAVRSPAASPLLGQFLTASFPGERRLITALLGLAGLVALAGVLRRFPPHTTAAAAGAAAFALLLATVLAPATRFGYLIYPANLALWAGALAPQLPGERRPPPHEVEEVTAG
jgi:Glycosyltransferase family 87